MDEQVKAKTTDNPDPFTNEFSRQIWEVTYKTQNENSITDTWKRVANAVANVEKDDESKRFYAEAFYEILKDFKFIPGGRILANAGGSCTNVSLVNCFCKGARVLTDHGYVPIENVVKGDLVLTHKGNWKPVVNTLKRNYKGDLVVFNDSMLSDELHATVEHPFLDSSGAWVPANQVKEVVFPKNSNLKEYITIDLYDYFKNLPKGIILYDTTKIWTKSSFVGGNGAQGVKESETIDRHIKVTEEFAYILGRFAGDGSSFTAPQNKNNYFSKHAFNICFSKKEVTSLTYCKKILEETFKFKVHINGQPTRNFQYLRKFNFIVATFLHKIIGDKSYNKRIPTCIWKSPKSVQFAFLCGFVDADGCVTQKGTICVTLKNKTLVQELQSLCSMVGIFSRLSPKKLYGKMSKYQTDQYVGLYINKKFSQILLPYLKKIYADNRLNSSFCEKACSSKTSCNCMPISTKIIAYEGEVYNLSVQDDESYIVNNIVTHNCYLSPAPKYDMDSIEGIMEVLKNQVLTLKSEGGWGLNCSFIRPRGSYIEGIGARTPGAVKYLELFDKSSEIITEGPGEYYTESKEKTPKNEKKKIRKGAMMLCLSCWHPDIYEFIAAKQKPFHLTKMNMSVNVTNAFMDILNRVNELVKNNASQEEIDAVDFWQLRFPDTAFEKYKSEWDGDLDKWEKKGYPVKVYRTVRATDLWEALMQSTSNRSEPGVLFLDRANETHCANYIHELQLVGTNPCGEQVLYSGGCCNLGSINLTAFIEYDETKHAAVFNFQKFSDIIPYCVRFLDNVIDIANLPLEEYKYMAESYRRIGLGITGIGSALMMLGLKYDSKEAKDFLTKVFDVYNFLGIRASIALAKCKGAFKGCNPAKHADNIKYTFRHLPKYILDALQKELLETNGIRNSALFSVQPTGNTGCLANNISGGVEPVFQLEYYRIVGVPIVPESIKDKCPRFWEGDFTPNNYFKEVKYADFTYLSYVTETGQEYQIHKDRGLCEKVKIRDYAYQWILDHNLEYPQEVFTTAMQLPVESHLEILKLVSAHLDSAVSKTINVGKDYPYEQFKNVYLDAYNSGVIKGVTTYREGSMSAVLQATDSKDDVNPTSTSIIHPTITAEKRPDILPCRVFFRTVKGISYYFIVSFLENSPFEMFIDINEDNIFDEDGEWVERRRIIPKTVKEGTLKKLGKATFEFVSKDEKFIFKIVKANESSDKATLTALARLVALNLQSGVSVKEIIHQLSKTEGDFTSIVKAINKVLSQCAGKVDLGETCPVCGGKVLREEGCKKCYACGWSACG